MNLKYARLYDNAQTCIFELANLHFILYNVSLANPILNTLQLFFFSLNHHISLIRTHKY